MMFGKNENNSICVNLIAKLPASPQSVLRDSNICQLKGRCHFLLSEIRLLKN